MKLSHFIETVNDELGIEIPSHLPRELTRRGILSPPVKRPGGILDYGEQHLREITDHLNRPLKTKYEPKDQSK